MNEKYKDKGPNFKCNKVGYLFLFQDVHMDARAIEFEDGSFDVAVDKGTLDALLVIHFKILNFFSVEKLQRLMLPR